VKEVEAHVGECKCRSLAIKKCSFCGILVDSAELVNKAHRCGYKRLYQLDEVSLFTKDRIANWEEVRKEVESFSCLLCSNLMNQPSACKHCHANCCRVCLANFILKEDKCPRCSHNNPIVSKI